MERLTEGWSHENKQQEMQADRVRRCLVAKNTAMHEKWLLADLGNKGFSDAEE
jgi:hypothetical protein